MRAARGIRLGGQASALCVALLSACKGPPELPRSESSYSELSADRILWHENGPKVRLDRSGPARFVRPLYEDFEVDRAMRLVAFMDERVRTPAGPGFDEVLDEFERELRGAGFGSQEGLLLEVLTSRMDTPSWYPRSARLALLLPGGEERVLHEFSAPADRDRCMLPRNAPSTALRARVAFDLETLGEGEVLVTRTRVRRDLVNRARSRGAVAIVSASLGTYNLDPSGRDRHVDAIQYRELPDDLGLPVVQISERSFDWIQQEALRSGSAELALEARTERGPQEVRTLVATIQGDAHAGQAVVIASHIQEPGASDNASGAAGALEGALCIVRAMRAGRLARPARSIVFVFGQEFGASQAWLARGSHQPVAAIAPVMLGNSQELTGALALLERHPDPGALEALPPDQHSTWGASPIEPAWLERPNGLALIGRCALVDVSMATGSWRTSENPFEGGTDHQVFVQHGVPAVLFWHFVDFSFNTNLDRIELVDGEELRRTAVAAIATALAVAAPEPKDLDRYLRSNLDELELRRSAALAADRPELAAQWERWCTDVRHWFRWLCLGAEPPPAKGAAAAEPPPE